MAGVVTTAVRRAVVVEVDMRGSTYGTAQYWTRLWREFAAGLDRMVAAGEIPGDFRPDAGSGDVLRHSETDERVTMVALLPGEG